MDATLDPTRTVGVTHAPYRGKPAYLAAARAPLPAATASTAGQPRPCTQRTQACDERLRAELAGVDGQVLALSTPPSEVELQALRLSLVQLRALLRPYPDLTSEADELAQRVEGLPSLSANDQAAAHKRMLELLDLLRVQLAAAQ